LDEQPVNGISLQTYC